jgi:hypothetical protein
MNGVSLWYYLKTGPDLYFLTNLDRHLVTNCPVKEWYTNIDNLSVTIRKPNLSQSKMVNRQPFKNRTQIVAGLSPFQY